MLLLLLLLLLWVGGGEGGRGCYSVRVHVCVWEAGLKESAGERDRERKLYALISSEVLHQPELTSEVLVRWASLQQMFFTGQN